MSLLTANYAVVPDPGSKGEAVYKVLPGDGPTDRTGSLIHRADGPADEFVAGLEATGASVERLVDGRHLLDPSGFPETVDFTAPETAETVMVREAARLRAQADSEDHDDGMNGGWGNAGGRTRAKAEAFEEALEIVRRFPR